jgi:pyruvate/2-oxoglutarate dehydrogenase complex dihydrolipoamide acyltransferase (E2) component
MSASIGISTGPMPRQRRHTLYFLAEACAVSPVFLDTEVDMTAVTEHRAAARQAGVRYSLSTYVLHAAGRVLARHPDANVAVRGGLRYRIARFAEVSGKLTFDKTLDGRRVVLSAVLHDLDRASLDEIQERVDALRAADPDTSPEFAPARLLDRLPPLLGAFAFRRAVRPLRRRAARMGTFALTSLGHRAVDGFHSVGGTTVTIGLGRVAPRPVVRDDRIAVAPVMRMSLAFDHRAIDGAEAADVLTDLKDDLEAFTKAESGQAYAAAEVSHA